MSDYISRKAVVELCPKNIEIINSGAYIDLDELLNLVDGIPAADVVPVRRWIPCSERLPEEGKKVLVYIPPRDGTAQYGHYIAQIREVKGGTDNFWGIPTADSPWTVWAWGYFAEPIVTHWMPLPEPPKKGCAENAPD